MSSIYLVLLCAGAAFAGEGMFDKSKIQEVKCSEYKAAPGADEPWVSHFYTVEKTLFNLSN
jgi:hypothetical protein